MPEKYIRVILLINESEEIGEKQLSVFGSRGGQISPLMHITLFRVGKELVTLLMGMATDGTGHQLLYWDWVV